LSRSAKGCLFTCTLTDIAESDEAIRAKLSAARHGTEEALSDRFQKAIDEGERLKRAAAQLLAVHAVSLMHGLSQGSGRQVKG
jgi:hypothetical protein